MGTDILIYGFAIFSVCLAVHVVIWRIKTPWVSSAIILLIFLFFPAACLIFIVFGTDGLRNAIPLNNTQIAEVYLFDLSLSLSYVAVYPAVRAVSPSLDILLMIASSPGKRMREDEMKKFFADKRLVTARIDDLKEYRLISENGERFRISPVARMITVVFIVYRKLLGLSAGEG